MKNRTVNILDRVLIEKSEHIAFVTLNRPEKFNALDLPMMKAIVRAKKAVEKDKAVRVVILQGAGASFCAGLDVSQFKTSALSMALGFLKYGRRENLYQRIAKVWRDLPVPVISVIHGHCLGGGLQIAMGSDFRYVAPDSQFSIMEAKWGLIPDMAGLLAFPELMRIDQFMELTMTAKMISAQDAQAMGLVTHVVDDPMHAAKAFANELLLRSPDAHAATKKLARKVWLRSSERKTLFWETWYQVRLLILGKNQKIAIHNNNPKKQPKPYRNRSI